MYRQFSVLSVVLLIAMALLTAIATGLARLGWQLPVGAVAAHHGAIMTSGFLGSVIMMERVVVLKHKWLFAVPLVNVASVLFFITARPLAGYGCLVAGSGAFCAVCLYFLVKFKEVQYVLFLVSAGCLLTGNIILFRTFAYRTVVPYWILFFVLLITAERIELARFLPVSGRQLSLLAFFLAIALAGAYAGFHAKGNGLMAVGLGGVAIWLLRCDMAMKSLRSNGQYKYTALLLVSGYIWLLLTACFMPVPAASSLWYDAVLHCFFLGFVFSMIFAHAPVILPGLLKQPMKLYRPLLYVWFGLMQLSLAGRVIADLLGDMHCRRIFGLLNGIAILAFMVTILVTVVQEKRRLSSLKNSRR